MMARNSPLQPISRIERIVLPALALLDEWQQGGNSAVEALLIYDMLEASHGDLLAFLDALHSPQDVDAVLLHGGARTRQPVRVIDL